MAIIEESANSSYVKGPRICCSSQTNNKKKNELWRSKPDFGLINAVQIRYLHRHPLDHRHAYGRLTVSEFLDIKPTFDSVNRSTIWGCLLRYGVLRKYVSITKSLYRHTSKRVRTYDKTSPPFVVSGGVQQEYSNSTFLSNFAIEDLVDDIHLLSGPRLTDLG